MGGQVQASAALNTGKRISDIYCISGWVGPRAGLDALEKRKKFFAPVGDLTLTPL
jgi:hypothetical protein